MADSDDGWVEGGNRKNKRNKKKKQERETEDQNQRQYWKNLKETYPHIITPQEALKLEKAENIQYLTDALLCSAWIDIQKEGWEYHSIIREKDDKGYEAHGPVGSKILPILNDWGDAVCFVETNQ